MKARISSEYERGLRDGIARTMIFTALALHNEYGWTTRPVMKVLTEMGRTAQEAAKDPEWRDTARRGLERIGIPAEHAAALTEKVSR